MWKCSQCETLNGDDSPICIICGMSREEVLAEQKRLELERALAASIPAKKPEVTLNWPKEEDTPAPEEPAKRPRWKDLRDSMDEQTRERWLLAGRVLAFAALLVQLTLHVTHEDPMLETVFRRWYGSAFPETLYALAAPATALLIPSLLSRKRRIEALLAALVFTFVHVVAAVSLYNRFDGSGLLSQTPSLLLGVVLLSCAGRGEIQDWMVPTMRIVTIVSATSFVLFTFLTTAGILTPLGWTQDWTKLFVISNIWKASHTKAIGLLLIYFYPIHRVFLALAVTLLFRANREK